MGTSVHISRPRVRAWRMDDAVPIRMVLRAMWTHRVGIVIWLLAVMLVVSTFLVFTAPVYRASATLMIENKKTPFLSFDPFTRKPISSDLYLQTQFALLNSQTLVRHVVSVLKLQSHPELDVERHTSIAGMWNKWIARLGLSDTAVGTNADQLQRLDAATRRLQQLITVEPIGKSQVVRVQVDMEDAATAAIVANALVHGYVDIQKSDSTLSAQTSSAWLGKRLTALRSELQLSQARLQQYREAQQIVDIRGAGTVAAQQLSLNTGLMIDARQRRAVIESQYRQIAAIKPQNWQQLAGLPLVMADPLVQALKGSYAQAESELDAAKARFGERHPARLAAQSRLDAAAVSLRSQVEVVVAGVERNYRLALADEASLVAAIDKGKSDIQGLSRKDFQLQALQSDVDRNQQLFDTFDSRLRETAASADQGSAITRVIDEAIAPDQPVRPNKPITLMVSALVALILGGAAAVIRDIISRKFESADQVEEILKCPVMGILPMVSSPADTRLSTVFSQRTHRRFGESMRSLRTGVVIGAGMPRQQQLIIVTSAVAGEGKTTVATNLSLALSQLGKVLLIDASLRRSAVAEQLEITGSAPGLTDLVAGTATLAECVQQVRGVDVITAGSPCDDPLDLLSSQRFFELIDALKQSYSRIVIDASTIGTATDALVQSAAPNLLLCVLKVSSTTVQVATRGMDALRSANVASGVVINQVEVRKQVGGQMFSRFYDYSSYSEGET